MLWKNKAAVFFDGMLLAFQFLTTIPIRKQVTYDQERAKMAVFFYPVTGLVLGGLLSVQFMLLDGLPPAVLSLWLLFFSIIFSGGLHLDGWMDVSDAIFSHRDKEKKLAIMKDSHVGAFSVLSVIFLLAWRFVFIYETLELAGSKSFFYLAVIPFLVRLQIAPVVFFGKPANKEGMAALLKPFVTKTTLFVVLLFIFTASAVIWIVFGTTFIGIWGFALTVLLLFNVVSHRLFMKHFGGITGDTIGTQIEGGETTLWLGMWLLLYFGTG